MKSIPYIRLAIISLLLGASVVYITYQNNRIEFLQDDARYWKRCFDKLKQAADTTKYKWMIDNIEGDAIFGDKNVINK